MQLLQRGAACNASAARPEAPWREWPRPLHARRCRAAAPPPCSSRQALSQRRCVVAAAQQQQAGTAAAAAAAAASAPRFAQAAGPGAFSTLPLIKQPLGPSLADPSVPLELQLEVLVPEGGPSQRPVVLFTPGFLLNSSLYRSYAARLAAWGYTCVLWDLSEVLDDTMMMAYLKQVLDMCARDARICRHCDTSRLLLAGHSRGAKLSCLVAQQEPRVQGLMLLDPVDNSSWGPQGVGYPSALPALSAAAAARQLPVLVVGAALNTDVVPPEANWRRFTSAAAAGGAPVMEVVLRGASHLQFLDKQQPLFALFSNNGPTPDADVRLVTQALMLAFTQLALCPGGPASAAQPLLAEEAAALQRVAPLDVSFRNFSQAAASGGAEAAGPRVAGAGGAGAASSQPQRRSKPITASYDQLMGMRAAELKRLLLEAGVEAGDCFEKADLARRVLERCT